jgi:2'-5' RNA ligase
MRGAGTGAGRGDPERMRTFAAVVPPPAAARGLAAIGESLSSHLPGLRWVPVENLHFTLRFFGDLTPGEIARAGEVADQVAVLAVPFPVELDRLGVFPGWGRPRILWAGCGTGSPTLEALARTLDRSLAAAGLGRADKDFVAHITLARWREPARLLGDDLRTLCEGERVSTRFEVGEVRLLRSELGRGGPTYSPLHVSPFGSRSAGSD